MRMCSVRAVNSGVEGMVVDNDEDGMADGEAGEAAAGFTGLDVGFTD
jgi:hypothetical protein